MVVTVVTDSVLFAQMSAGVKSAKNLQEDRAIKTWIRHSQRGVAHDAWERERMALRRKRHLASMARKAAKKAAFLEKHSFSNLRDTLDVYQNNKYRFVSDEHKQYTVLCVKKHAKQIKNDTSLLYRYMDKNGRLPTKWMRQMVDARSRKNQKFIHMASKKRQIIKNKYNNIFNYLSESNARLGIDVDVRGEPELEYLGCELTGESPILIKNKIRHFDDLINNVRMDDSPYILNVNKYINLSLRNRYNIAVKNGDLEYIKILDKYIKFMKKFDIVYTNLPQIQRAAVPEMEAGAHGMGTEGTDSSQNVVIASARDVEYEQIPRIPRCIDMNTEDTVGSFNEMVDRWIILDKHTWSASTKAGEKVLQLHLPNAFVIHPKLQNLISIRPFYNHRLWSGDMSIKIEINSNKFQFGQLQCSFYYGLVHDKHRKLRENLVSLSQCMHCLLDAGAKNAIELEIPFKNQSPMICVSNCGDQAACYIGSLNIFCLNPLMYSPGSPSDADIVIYFKLKNSKFSGQISADLTSIIAIPEMEALAMAGAMKLLDTVASDANRDNPPGVIPPAYVVPTATHSWSVGTDSVEPLQTLRLSSRAQVHHPRNISMDQHNTLRDLLDVYTFTATLKWSRSTKQDESLMNLEMSPDGVTFNVDDKNHLSIQKMSIITILSSMFMQWRGSVDLRFDFVASQFHTGSVLVAFIPDHTEAVTIHQAMSSFYATFDLAEMRSFTFTVPYINKNMWIRRRAQMDAVSPNYARYGSVQMFVVNRLNFPSNVADNVYINVYARGGPSFELSVPIQPSIGLAYNNEFQIPINDILLAEDGQDDFYIGYWEGNSLNAIMPFVRWGTLAGRVVTFVNPKRFEVYRKDSIYFYHRKGVLVAGTVNKQSFRTVYNFFTLAYLDGTDYYLVPCRTAALAVRAWKTSYFDLNDYGMTTITENPYAGSKPRFTMMILAESEGERDSDQMRMDNTRNLFSTNFGEYLYGESFNSLKNLMRRYQHYGFAKFSTSNRTNSTVTIRFPVVPGGLDLQIRDQDGLPDPRANKCRDGIIPIILSGFKFYRGSIRFRIVIESATPTIMWTQHRPEMVCLENRILFSDTDDSELHVYAHGYASYVQSNNINNIIEIEVPFYQHGMFGLLSKPNNVTEMQYTSNGVLVVGMDFNGKTNQNFRVNVYYSLGDDFAFNTFQGFPSMVDQTGLALNVRGQNLPELLAVAEMNLGDWFGGTASKCVEKAIEKHGGRATEIIGKAIEGQSDKIKEVCESVKETIAEGLTEAVGVSEEKKKSLIAYVIGQLIHFFTNPSIKTAVACIVNFLLQAGVEIANAYERICKFVQYVYKMFTSFFKKQQKKNEEMSQDKEQLSSDKSPVDNQQPSTSREEPILARAENGSSGRIVSDRIPVFHHPLENIVEEPMLARAEYDTSGEDHGTLLSWINLIWTAVIGIIGCKKKIPDPNFGNYVASITSGTNLRDSNAFYTFIRNNCRLVVKFVDLIKRWLDPTYYMMKLSCKKNGPLQTWLKHTRQILFTNLREDKTFKPLFCEEVTALVVFGQNFLAKLDNLDNFHPSIRHDVEKKLEKLLAVEEKLKLRGQYAYCRPKPLHVQMFGDPGVGKSSCVNALSDYILREVCGIEPPINSICTVKASSKFWDQCTGNEPTVLLDDLWAVTTPNLLDSQLTNYIELYGTTVFAPPKAAVEDKNMRYAPKLMISTTNHPWKTFPDVCDTAIWRRMDILLKVTAAPLDPDANPDCPHCSGEQSDLALVYPHHLEDFHHLQFQLANKLTNEAVSQKKYTWKQLLAYIKSTLSMVWRNNMAKFEMDVSSFGEAFEDMSNEAKFDDDLALVYKKIIGLSQRRWHDAFEDLGMRVRNSAAERFDAMKAWIPGSFRRFEIKEKEREAEAEMDVASSLLRYGFEERSEFFTKDIAELDIQMSDPENTIIINCIRAKKIEQADGNFDRMTMKHIVFEYASKYSGCLHVGEDFPGASYYNGQFIFDDGSIRGELEKCAGGCIMASKFERVFMKYWVLNNTSAARYYRMRKLKHLPRVLHDELLEPVGKMTYVIEYSKLFADFVKSQFRNESVFMRGARWLKKAMWGVIHFMMDFWPLMIILGTWASAYFAFSNNEFKAKYKTFTHEAHLNYEEVRKRTMARGIIEAIRDMPHHKQIQYVEDLISEDLAKSGPPFPQSSHYNEVVIRHGKTVSSRGIPKIANPQSTSQQASVAEKRLRSNAVWITANFVVDGRAEQRKFMCLQLRGYDLLVLRHYIEFWSTLPEDTMYHFTYVEDTARIGQGVGIPIDIPNLQRRDMYYELDENNKPKNDCNWTILTLPATIQQVKDVTKFFAMRSQHRYIQGEIMFVRPGDPTHILPLIRSSEPITMGAVPGGQPLTMEEVFLYRKHAPGYCGSGIIYPGLERPIVGIHVAAWGNYGCAEPIFGDCFSSTPTVKAPFVDIAEMHLQSIDYADINLDTVLYPKGCVPPNMASSQSDLSQFTKTPLAGKILPIETEPMPLSEKDERMNGMDPLKMGAEKHGLFSIDFKNYDVQECRDHLGRKLLNLCQPVVPEVGVMDLQTAICGDKNVPLFTPLKWAASEGFPLVKSRPSGTTGKEWLFEKEETKDGYILRKLHPELDRIYVTQMEMRKRGIRPDTVFMDVLKDECREKAKARTPGKTRVFSTAPIQYVIAFRQYFGHFLAAYRNNRIDTEHGIGMNCDSAEWTHLARYLQKRGPKIMAGDYSHFGYTLNSSVMQACFDIMISWFAKHSTSDNLEEEQIVRKILASEIINCKHLCRNFVYQVLCGMPSGFPATDILNSMVNCLYIRLAWKGITKRSLYEFDQHVSMITYGDDLAANISDEIAEEFNTQTIQKFFAKHNIKFTDIDKTGEVIKYRTLTNTPFLKRTFVPHPIRPGVYLAQLDEMSIGNCLNWMHKKDDVRMALYANCTSALTLAYGFGPDYYKNLKEQIQDFFSENYNQNFEYYNWYDLDRKAFGEN